MTAIICGDKGTDNKLDAKGTELGSGIRTTVASRVQAVAVRNPQGKRNSRSTGDNFQKSREQAVQVLQDNRRRDTNLRNQGTVNRRIKLIKLTEKPDVRWSQILYRG